MRSPYQILSIPRTATPDDIRRAYRARAKKLHPDHGGSPEKFRELRAAYDILSDPRKRADYDARRNAPKPPKNPAKTAKARPVRVEWRDPHPGAPPPSRGEQDAILQALRAVGLSLAFGVASEFAPDSRTRDTMTQAQSQADKRLADLLDSILGG